MHDSVSTPRDWRCFRFRNPGPLVRGYHDAYLWEIKLVTFHNKIYQLKPTLISPMQHLGLASEPDCLTLFRMTHTYLREIKLAMFQNENFNSAKKLLFQKRGIPKNNNWQWGLLLQPYSLSHFTDRDWTCSIYCPCGRGQLQA